MIIMKHDELTSHQATTGTNRARCLYDLGIGQKQIQAPYGLLREGRSVTYVANAHGVDHKTVVLWCDRYEQKGRLKRKKGTEPKRVEEFTTRSRLILSITTAQVVVGNIYLL